MISQIRSDRTNGLPVCFARERCRPTLGVFDGAWWVATSTQKRRGKKWIYVAAWVETVRGGREDEIQGRRRADGDMWP